MAVSINEQSISVPASADLSTKQYYLGSINSSGQVAVTGAGAAADGVILNDPAAQGRATALQTTRGSVAKVIAGNSITAGDALEADGSGRVITRSSGVRVGKALEGAGAAGDIISVLLYLESA